MTDKQKDFILELDKRLEENNDNYSSEEILGSEWITRYKEIPIVEASKCIRKLLKEVKYATSTN